MNSCWLQSSTRHNEKFPVGSHQPSQSAAVQIVFSLYSLQATLDGSSSLSWKYQAFSQKHPPALGGPPWSAWWANILEPKNISFQTNRKHFGGNLGNYRAIWSSGSSQVLTLNGIFRSCFYKELFQADKLILIFVLLKNFGQIFNFLSCGTKSCRWNFENISLYSAYY